MKFKLFYCLLLALIISAVLPAFSSSDEKIALKDATILIIRHAEKPDEGSGLSPDGMARAEAYVNYFKKFTIDGQPLKLTHLFAAADSKASRRPRLTLEPISRALGLPLDTRFKNKDFQGLVDEIQTQPHGNAILIAWHHEKIPALLQALGADPVQVIQKSKWPEDVFGWVIELRYGSKGELVKAKRINEKLMPDDL
jgi:hypothetical protein